MRLNKSKGRMFKKVSHTGTFIQGCDHDCVYGWCKRVWTISHEPKLVGDPHQVLRVRDAYIFLNSAHDTYSSIIPGEWITLQHDFIARQHPSNKFLEETKNTPRIFDFLEELEAIKDRLVLGTTYETNRYLEYSKFSKAPPPDVRLRDMAKLSRMGFDTMGSIEPVMDFDTSIFASMIIHANPRYVEIGADNYKCGLPEPTGDPLDLLISMLESAGIEAIRKDGLERLYK